MNTLPTPPTTPADLGVPLDDGDDDGEHADTTASLTVFQEDPMLSLELTNMEGLITAHVHGLRVDRPDRLRPKHYYAAGRYPAGNVLMLHITLDQVRVHTYLDLDDPAGRSMAQTLSRQTNIPVVVRTTTGTNLMVTSPQSPVKLRELANILSLAADNKPVRRDWAEAVKAFESVA